MERMKSRQRKQIKGVSKKRLGMNEEGGEMTRRRWRNR
jgi:hypothetical protein